MDKDKVKKEYYVFFAIGALFILYFAWHVAIAYDTSQDIGNILQAMLLALQRMQSQPFDLKITTHFRQAVVYGGLGILIAYIYIFSNKKKTLFGKEQGSARWATDAEAKRLKDAEEDRNMILTNEVFISMNTRKTFLNNNILVIGGSGSGKTRYFAKPNMLQCGCSYVITDPKGENLKSTGAMFKDNGYIVKVLNLIERDHSHCYNPLHYIHKPSDAYKLVNQIVKNTNPEGKMGGGSDPFWEKSEILLLYALILYMWMELEKNAVNFRTLMELIGKADASEEDENAMSDLDFIFNDLKERKGETYLPVTIYSDYKKAAGKTAKSILISVAARMNPFRMPDVQQMTLTDTMELEKVGDKKTALFIITSDSDMTFNFMASIMYSQLFNELYFAADFGKLGWENNQILFRTPQGLLKKKKELEQLYENYDKAIADKKRLRLYKKIRQIIIECKEEFGLPYPSLPIWDSNEGKATYIDEQGEEEDLETYLERYLDTMESCVLRLHNRRNTLREYKVEYEKLNETIRVFKGSQAEAALKEIANAKEKKGIIEERIKNEFGISKMYPVAPKKRFKVFAANKKEVAIYETEVAKVEKNYLNDVEYLLMELNSKSFAYGSRDSFEDKLERIKKYKSIIKRTQKTLKDLGKRQEQEKEVQKEKIKEYERKVKRVEALVAYEFGIKDLSVFKRNGGRLPIHVRCILDEFANITPIPDFAKLIATMRSREISVSIILQNISQLKEMYKDNWESISGNCDSFLFLGGQEQSTLKYVSEQLGKATIDKRSTGISKGGQGSSSQNWDVLGRELLTQDELRTMKGNECILFVRGFFPFRSIKYDLEKHKRYNQLADNDADPRTYWPEKELNTLDVAKGIDKDNIMNDNGLFELELQKETERIIGYISKNQVISGDIEPSLFDSDNLVVADTPVILQEANNNIQRLLTNRIIIELEAGRINLEDMTMEELEVINEEMRAELELATGIEENKDIFTKNNLYENQP